MIDPPRGVAAPTGIDDTTVAGLEDERVLGMLRVAVRDALLTISHVVRSPRYSRMTAPLRIVLAANTPRPWMAEWRTR